MRKEEYLSALKTKLEENAIPNPESMVSFYEEMIADRMEDGMSEEEAVSAMEDISAIVENAKLDKTLPALMLDKVKESRKKADNNSLGVLWVILAILGFPIWFPLTITFLSLVFALYVTLWSIVLSIYAVEIALGLASVACFIGGFAILFGAIPLPTALCFWGISLLFAGICLLLWKPICAVTKGMIDMIRWLFRKIKGLFVKGGDKI